MGCSAGSFVTHESGYFIYLYIGGSMYHPVAQRADIYLPAWLMQGILHHLIPQSVTPDQFKYDAHDSSDY